MDTPHNDKQRKSLFPYKLAQTLVGLIAVCFLIFCIRSPSTSSPSPFQTTSSEKETALKWIFITPYGETDSSYADLFLSQEDCTELAGTPVERSGLGDLLKNAEPINSIGIDSQYTVPITHYEILFSLYSNSRLATADERKQKFLENQIVNLVEDCSADEIAPTYARLVSELQRGDYKLLDTWKKQQYQKAISILQE
jgi:hypothetical protein